MKKDTLDYEINPNVKKSILRHIFNQLSENEKLSIRKLKESYNGIIKRSEFLYVIKEGISKKYLNIVEEKKDYEDNLLEISGPHNFSINNQTKLVMSFPNLNDISLSRISKRNNIMPIKKCFEDIFNSVNDTLRICSPFLEKNISRDDVFPEVKKYIRELLEDNKEIKIISRELEKRQEEIQWIVNIAKETNRLGNLQISDYYIRKDGYLFSSTHAKILISDKNKAYVGSGELRKNSINVNLEIGSLIEGDSVFGLCEVFDYIFDKGERYV